MHNDQLLSAQPPDDASPLSQQFNPPLVVPGSSGANLAADLIRSKLAQIYAEEPDPFAELKQSAIVKPRSKHQQFMYDLSRSGRSLADIQVAWHTYYASLPDVEKHAVWQEFYEANHIPQSKRTSTPLVAAQVTTPQPIVVSPTGPLFGQPQTSLSQATADPMQLRERIRNTVSANGRLTAKHHAQSLLFGLAVGMITVVIFLFGFFNEVIIAPFIQPGRNVGATPIIVDPSTVAIGSSPEVIIPKINLEIPADFSQTSTDEATIENALENGVVHYPSTVMPGQIGNTAFFGHSSNNIFNPGKYKFAFVLLHELVPGDTFYITYNGRVYIYKVFSRQIVDPNDVSVLNNIPTHATTASLITCDPPGTSLHRLVVTGDQISPDPSTNSGGNPSNVTPTQLPDDGPSLLSRFWHWLF